MVKGFTKTDSDGDFVYTLDEPGAGNIAVFGKDMMEYSIFILPVFESFPPTEEERVSAISETGTDTAPASESPASGLLTTIWILGLIAVLLTRNISGGSG